MNPNLPVTINVDLGKLSDPATALINKISEATGGIFRPWQIRRVAKARADANKVRALSKVVVAEISQRAMQRFVLEETKKQSNIENITSKTIPLLTSDSAPENIEDDWITNFFDKSRLVSDDEMQKLWAKLLASESNNPGTVSKRTVNFISTLDKNEAVLFTNLCSYGWIGRNQFIPLIFDSQADVYNKEGINFDTLKHLDSIGLISFESIAGYVNTKQPKKILMSYANKATILEFDKVDDNQLDIGKIILTNTGKQIARICNPKTIDGFYEYCLEHWMKNGVVVSCPYNHDPLF